MVDVLEHQLPPQLPLQGLSHTPAPHTQVLVTITPVDTPTLDPPSCYNLPPHSWYLLVIFLYALISFLVCVLTIGFIA